MTLDIDLARAEEDVRGVLDEVGTKLQLDSVEEIRDFLEHREIGLAAEGLFWSMDAAGLDIEPETRARLGRLRTLTNAHGDFDQQTVERVLDPSRFG